MANIKPYPYSVMVRGKKKFGGLTYAESMEQAVVQVAKQCKLTLRRNEYLNESFRLDGQRADIAIWAYPENFKDCGIPEG